MTGRTWSFRAHLFATLAVIVSMGLRAAGQDGPVINVSTVADLYAALDDPENVGGRIVLAPGTYYLDPTLAHAGRLELQQDMTLVGQAGDSEAVIIDASNLPRASFALDGFLTGAVRMGRGRNALEWVTIQNVVNGAAAVETDLPPAAGVATVRVAHILAQGNQRGIDFRNLGATFNGRVLVGIAEENVLRDNTVGEGQGVRVINTGGVTGATILAILRGNDAYGNLAGCAAANLNSSGNAVLIDSTADRFANNAIGCNLIAGASTAGVADSNVLVFEAHGDAIEQNDMPLPPSLVCQGHAGAPCYAAVGGVVAFGGETAADLPNRVSANLLFLALEGTRLSGNQDSDVHAFGALSTTGLFPGTDNRVEILLKGVSRQAALSIVDSEPPDPSGTNVVVVNHHMRSR